MGFLFGGGGGAPSGPPPSSFASSGAGAPVASPTAGVAGPTTITPGGVTVSDYQESQGDVVLDEQGNPVQQPVIGGTSGGTYSPPAAGSTLVVKPNPDSSM